MNTVTKNNNEAKFDDDKSWMSKGSIDAVGLLLDEDDSFEGKMTIEIMEKEEIDSLDGLVESLADIDDYDGIPDATSGWQGAFLSEDALPIEQELQTIISKDSSSIGETVGSLADDDISSLMTGELLEPTIPQPVVVNMMETRHNEAPSGNGSEPTSEADAISRIMAYIHHTEQDRRVVYQAEEIVHDCQRNHHRGDRRFKNLPGSIFEGLVKLFGGSKFNEIYRQSQSINLHTPVRQMSYNSDPSVPSMLELAIAYGLHMARTTDASKSSMKQVVQHGTESLNSMTDEERSMFWNYMTQNPKVYNPAV